MRHTRAHTANRRSHHALVKKAVSQCKDCGHPTPAHRACVNCGRYKGRNVIDFSKKIAKKTKKAKEKTKTK